MALIGGPGSFVVAVDGEGGIPDRSDIGFVSSAILVDGSFERAGGWVDGGSGVFQLEGFQGSFVWTGSESEFGEGGSALDGPSGAVEREIGVGEEIESNGANLSDCGWFVIEGDAGKGGGEALVHERVVREGLVFLAIVSDLVDLLSDPFCFGERAELMLPVDEVFLPVG